MVKILLVEDNPLNQDMLSRRLTRQGYQVVAATDGAVALSMAKSEKPDLILMDMNIPIIDGWEATRRLKADDLTQPIPVIALTAHAMVGDREKALAAGCDDYATKPVEFKPLLKLIRSFTAMTDETASASADLLSKRRSRANRVPLVNPFSAKPSASKSSESGASKARSVPDAPMARPVSESDIGASVDASVGSEALSQSRSTLQDISSQDISSQNTLQEGQSDNPFTLLLVNDNAVNREIMNTHLQRKGYSVIEAENPSMAMAILGDFSIDLVLLDITVPETANLALLQQLRSQYSKQTLPVVIVSSHSSDEEIVQAFELGVNDYATKPINLAIIMARIQSQLGTLQAARQADSVSGAQSSNAQSSNAQSSNAQVPAIQQSLSASTAGELSVIKEQTSATVEAETAEKKSVLKTLNSVKIPNRLETPDLLTQGRPIVTGALEPLPRGPNNAPQSMVQRSEAKSITETLAEFRDGAYSINHIFSKTPFSQVQLVENPNIADHSLCLAETFSPNIQDDEVLEDFRSAWAVERSQLKEIAKHDRIADLLSFFKQGDSFGWLQAYIEGMPLSEILSAENSNLSPQAVLQAMQEMLEALVPFHTKRLVHCSMQPQHVWRCSKTGSLLLINLGISQRLAAYLEMRSPKQHKGFNQEHSYMPIEQRIGQPELSSDVYSVGLISLQLLTGKTPSVLTNVLLSGDSLSQRFPSVPVSMLGLFSKLLAQDSQERYASAIEALKGLEEVSL